LATDLHRAQTHCVFMEKRVRHHEVNLTAKIHTRPRMENLEEAERVTQARKPPAKNSKKAADPVTPAQHMVWENTSSNV
jgi:hypothetical protein